MVKVKVAGRNIQKGPPGGQEEEAPERLRQEGGVESGGGRRERTQKGDRTISPGGDIAGGGRETLKFPHSVQGCKKTGSFGTREIEKCSGKLRTGEMGCKCNKTAGHLKR